MNTIIDGMIKGIMADVYGFILLISIIMIVMVTICSVGVLYNKIVNFFKKDK